MQGKGQLCRGGAQLIGTGWHVQRSGLQNAFKYGMPIQGFKAAQRWNGARRQHGAHSWSASGQEHGALIAIVAGHAIDAQ